MTKFNNISQNFCKIASITLLGTALLWGNASTAQDRTAYQDPIYPPLQKITLSMEPINLKLDTGRTFLYINETKELDRLLVHMSVKKDMMVEVICQAPPHSQDIAHLRADIVRGYLVDNGADLTRVKFIAKSHETDSIHIKAVSQ